MFFETYTLAVSILLFAIVFNASKCYFKKLWISNIVLLAGSIFMLLSLMKEHTIIVMGVLSIVVFLVGLLLQKYKNVGLFAGSIVFVLVLFAIRNYPAVSNLLDESMLHFVNQPILSVQKIGLSYILFRYVHWLIESYRRKIHKPNVLSFVNYIMFFPTYLAGPIDTYNNFSYWLRKPGLIYRPTFIFSGIARIFMGAAKTLLLVPLVINYATDYNELMPQFSIIPAIFVSLIFYSFYIYFDFSGYCDIAIGTAYILGIKTPENFNNPYFSSNLSEFWKRWHITFSMFLRLYVFKPVIALLNLIINPRNKLVVSILGYLITFTICGLWHGSTLNFVYWGLWHGVGLALNKLWRDYVVRDSTIIHSFSYKTAAIAITFVYVSVGWIFFHYEMSEIMHIFSLL